MTDDAGPTRGAGVTLGIARQTDIILIRHAARERPGDRQRTPPRSSTSPRCAYEPSYPWKRAEEEGGLPLTGDGVKAVEELRTLLQQLGLSPKVYLTSTHQYAVETGHRLAGNIGSDGTLVPKAKAEVVDLCALTPGSVTHTLEDLMTEAASEYGIVLSEHPVVGIVGHHPRISQLLERLTSQRGRPLHRAEAVWVRAESYAELLAGKGKVRARLPVRLPVDNQEEQLRAKLQSKMTVSTLLAGFTLTSLFELVKDTTEASSLLYCAAIVSLVAAVAQFIAAIYIFDRLSMPEVFWGGGDRQDGPWWRGRKFGEDLRRDGPIYAYMVWTWRRVFSWAVGLAVLGVLLLLASTAGLDVWEPRHWTLHTFKGAWLSAIGVAIGLAIVYYIIARPKLGTDD